MVKLLKDEKIIDTRDVKIIKSKELDISYFTFSKHFSLFLTTQRVIFEDEEKDLKLKYKDILLCELKDGEEHKEIGCKYMNKNKIQNELSFRASVGWLSGMNVEKETVSLFNSISQLIHRTPLK